MCTCHSVAAHSSPCGEQPPHTPRDRTPDAAAATHLLCARPPPPIAQASGGALVGHVRELSEASEVLDNLSRASSALAAARGVLRECLAAGRMVAQGRLYHALCALDAIRHKHLGEATGPFPPAPPPGPPRGVRGVGEAGRLACTVARARQPE